jgi:ribosome biogenesis GTPase A
MRRQSTNITPYWQKIRQMVSESDIVLEILDARLVELSRNEPLEKIFKEIGRPIIYVINKADLVSRKALEIATDKLKDETKAEVVYVSNRQTRTIKTLLTTIKKVFEIYGKREDERYNKFTPKKQRQHRKAKGDIVVGVFGYPNVGKSSVINSLAFKKKAIVTSKAGTTHGAHWISAGSNIKMIDTPGVIPLEYNDELRLALIAAKNPEKIKERDVVAAKIIEMFIESNKQALEKFYNIKIEREDSYDILEEIGEKKGHLKKGGVVDEQRTSTMIIRDWQQGKIKL